MAVAADTFYRRRREIPPKNLGSQLCLSLEWLFGNTVNTAPLRIKMLVVLTGPPACGKSTLVTKLQEIFVEAEYL
jgi:pantothenate kinase